MIHSHFYGFDPFGFITQRDAGRAKQIGFFLHSAGISEDDFCMFLKTQHIEQGAKFSPDGRWIVYQSNESGAFEVYVKPYPGPRGKWRISTDGGFRAGWSRDGKSLFYANNGNVYAVDVETEGGFRAGSPRLYFEGIVDAADNDFPFDSAPDGRMLVRLPAGEQAPQGRLHVVENWFEELKRLAPTGKN